MAKVNARTGSRVLGEELRRHRGIRTLKEISEMSRSEPFKGRIHPISRATICQMETGTVMPTVESLHSLAAIYEVSTQQLVDCIVQERLAAAVPLPSTQEATMAAFSDALRRGAWFDALAHAIHGERTAESARNEVVWRANRASCLNKMGLRGEAVDILVTCVDYPDLERTQRFGMLLNLVEVLMARGALHVAGVVASSPELQDTEGIDPSAVRHFLARKARLSLEMVDAGIDTAPQRVREAQRLLEQAKQTWPADDADGLFALETWLAYTQHLLKNDAVALRDLRNLVKRAQASRNERCEMLATLNLGLIKLERSDTRGAQSDLAHAASLAMKAKRHEEAFRAYFELYKLARSVRDPQEPQLWKRCQRIHPLLKTKSYWVLEFERLLRAQS
jgi:hypothetical protein